MNERRNGGSERILAGFAVARTPTGFVIHIIDASDEVFEIVATREHVELMLANLKAALASRPGEDACTEE